MIDLHQFYQTQMQRLGDRLDEFPWSNSVAYTSWLAQTFFFVKNSTRLLAVACGRVPQDNFNLHSRFIEHLREEKGHEKILLKDLANSGHNIGDFCELSSSAALYKTQYHWIEHVSVMSFFGYILFLEGLGAEHGKNIYNRVVTSHDVKSAQFLKIHGEEDVGHIELAMNQILDFPKEIINDVIKNFAYSADFYVNMISDIQAMSDGKSLISA